MYNSSKAMTFVHMDGLLLVASRAQSNAIWGRPVADLEFKDPPASLSQYFGALYTSSELDYWSPNAVQPRRASMVGCTQNEVDGFTEEIRETPKPVETPDIGERDWADIDGQARRFCSSCASQVAA